MENLDLNIHNYNLNDLLNLFHLPFQFNESHLKEAKKIVLKTHPDKCNLDKEYFLFFSKAYKYLFKIHQLRQSSTTSSTDYINDDLWEKDQTIIVDGIVKKMSQEEYNTWFNKTFEQMKLKDEIEENGYGDWLKSNEGIVTEKISNQNQMNEYILKKKNEIRSLVVHKEFEDINNNNSFDLVREIPEDYGSSVFNKLQFEDLRKAHEQSVIPVTEEDYKNRKKYTSMDELNRDRTSEINNKKDAWYANHEDKLKNVQGLDEEVNITRAYKLMNQDEIIRENHKKFWNNLKRIKN
tara:strand:- start:1047 stop:1928 length:882 start_codon:yes stop_codon:yes gene_type:complete